MSTQPKEPIKFMVITVSDTCFAHPSRDKSGPAVVNGIKKLIPKAIVSPPEILPDDLNMIVDRLKELTSGNLIDVIITTGGTGLSPRDVTPEATRHVVEYEIPGIPMAMIMDHFKHAPTAMLSKAVCGVRNRKIIINLPGSVSGASECLESIAAVIPHAVDVIRNNTVAVAATHAAINAQVQREPKHKCHGSTVNQSVDCLRMEKRISKVKFNAVAHRDRHSSFPMISVEEAFDLIEEVIKKRVLTSIFLPPSECLGQVAASNIFGDDLPKFNASIKDGYALKSSDGVGEYTVIHSIKAGEHQNWKTPRERECVRINTGAAVPSFFDAVVQVEDTVLVKEEGGEERIISVNVAPQPGQDIRKMGSDLSKNDIVVKAGTILQSAEIAALVSVRSRQVPIAKKPKIAVLSTGDELYDGNVSESNVTCIPDSNRVMLLTLFQQNNYETYDAGICKDDPDDLMRSLQKILEQCDILVTTGSVSMGDHDIVKRVLVEDFNATIHFGRVAMKPGKPATFATCVFNEKTKYIFALPGNPVSALVTTQLFVVYALRLWTRQANSGHTIIRLKAGDNFKCDQFRREYCRAKIAWQRDGPVAFCTASNQASSCLLSLVSANCLVILPVQIGVVKAGEMVDAVLLEPF